jgi:hypothetical protein
VCFDEIAGVPVAGDTPWRRRARPRGLGARPARELSCDRTASCARAERNLIIANQKWHFTTATIAEMTDRARV